MEHDPFALRTGPPQTHTAVKPNRFLCRCSIVGNRGDNQVVYQSSATIRDDIGYFPQLS